MAYEITPKDVDDLWAHPSPTTGQASTYNPQEASAYIAQAAQKRGIDPNVALRVARSEGLNQYTGDEGSSFGPFQLHYGNVAPGGNRVGGLGDVFTQRTGLDARDPRTWRQQIDFSLDEAAKSGWGPWHGWKGHERAGLPGSPQMLASASMMNDAGPQSQGDWLEQTERTFSGPQQAAPPLPKAWEPPELKPIQPYIAPVPATPAEAPANWGAGRSFTTGLTLGAEPYIEAGLSTLANKPEGMGYQEAFRTALGNIQQQREQYQQARPTTAMLAEGGGALVGTALPMAAAGRGVAMGAQALGRIAPRAKPAIEAVGRFLSGQTAATGEGLGAGIARGASYAGQGAVQGVGQAALTQGLQPEDVGVGESLLRGAAGGAVGGAFINPLVSGVVAPFTARIAQPLRDMAQSANAKFGLNIRPTQIAQDAEIKALDARVIPQHLHDEQVLKFNEELAKQVGMGGRDLTNKEVQAQMRKVGDDLTNIAANTSMATTKNLYQDLGAIRQDVYATTLEDSPLRTKVDGIIKRIFNEIQPTRSGSKWQFELPGTKFRALTKYQGLIDKELGASADPAMRTVGHDLKTALFDMFEVADPAKAGAYNKARGDYRKLMAVAPLAEKSTSGVLDPTKVLSQVNRKGLTGDIRELAEAGQHLPKSTSTGTAKPAPKITPAEAAQRALQYGPVPLGAYAAHWLGLPPEATAIGAALLGGGQALGAGLRNVLMANPAVGRNVLAGGTVVPTLARGAGALGTRGVSQIPTEVGVGRGR
jgi:hypothetical protein